jgi:hypothetical protein
MKRTMLVSVLILLRITVAGAAGSPDTITRVQPAMITVGTVTPLRQGRQDLRGTGFALGGNRAITDSHVAYPGNSGSPAYYDPERGRVSAVVNSTFVSEIRETAITSPSGISDTIPVSHVCALLAGAGVKE